MKQIEKRMAQLETKIAPKRTRFTVRITYVGKDADGNIIEKPGETFSFIHPKEDSHEQNQNC